MTMLHYADLIKRDYETVSYALCPMCGRSLRQTFVPEEEKTYVYCEKCKVIRCMLIHKKVQR